MPSGLENLLSQMQVVRKLAIADAVRITVGVIRYVDSGELLTIKQQLRLVRYRCGLRGRTDLLKKTSVYLLWPPATPGVLWAPNTGMQQCTLFLSHERCCAHCVTVKMAAYSTAANLFAQCSCVPWYEASA